MNKSSNIFGRFKNGSKINYTIHVNDMKNWICVGVADVELAKK